MGPFIVQLAGWLKGVPLRVEESVSFCGWERKPEGLAR